MTTPLCSGRSSATRRIPNRSEAHSSETSCRATDMCISHNFHVRKYYLPFHFFQPFRKVTHSHLGGHTKTGGVEKVGLPTLSLPRYYRYYIIFIYSMCYVTLYYILLYCNDIVAYPTLHSVTPRVTTLCHRRPSHHLPAR